MNYRKAQTQAQKVKIRSHAKKENQQRDLKLYIFFLGGDAIRFTR